MSKRKSTSNDETGKQKAKKLKQEEVHKAKLLHQAVDEKLNKGEIVIINKDNCVVYELNKKHIVSNEEEWYHQPSATSPRTLKVKGSLIGTGIEKDKEKDASESKDSMMIRPLNSATLHVGIRGPLHFDSITLLKSSPFGCYLDPSRSQEALRKLKILGTQQWSSVRFESKANQTNISQIQSDESNDSNGSNESKKDVEIHGAFKEETKGETKEETKEESNEKMTDVIQETQTKDKETTQTLVQELSGSHDHKLEAIFAKPATSKTKSNKTAPKTAPKTSAKKAASKAKDTTDKEEKAGSTEKPTTAKHVSKPDKKDAKSYQTSESICFVRDVETGNRYPMLLSTLSELMQIKNAIIYKKDEGMFIDSPEGEGWTILTEDGYSFLFPLAWLPSPLKSRWTQPLTGQSLSVVESHEIETTATTTTIHADTFPLETPPLETLTPETLPLETTQETLSLEIPNDSV